MYRNSVKHFFALFCISLIALQHATVLVRFRQPPQRRQVKHPHRHVIRRGGDLLCEGTEVRAFVICDPANPDRIKVIPIPADIRALCS